MFYSPKASSWMRLSCVCRCLGAAVRVVCSQKIRNFAFDVRTFFGGEAKHKNYFFLNARPSYPKIKGTHTEMSNSP